MNMRETTRERRDAKTAWLATVPAQFWPAAALDQPGITYEAVCEANRLKKEAGK